MGDTALVESIIQWYQKCYVLARGMKGASKRKDQES